MLYLFLVAGLFLLPILLRLAIRLRLGIPILYALGILLHLTRRILNCFTVSIKTEALRSSVFLDTVSTLLRPR